jgi:flagellar export protein FliJ
VPKPLKSQRMNLLAELAQTKEDKASEQLKAAREILDREVAQLEGLQDYRRNSIANKGGSSNVSNAFLLTANQHFLAQIQGAIEEQEAVVGQARKNFERVLAIWVELREKHKTLLNLARQAHDNEEAAREKKLEQRQMDDFIAAKYRRS